MNKPPTHHLIAALVVLLLLSAPVLAAHPPSPASWCLHRGTWENQGITPGSDSPITDHELWNNSTVTGSTCDPVAANITLPAVIGNPLRNVLYTGRIDNVEMWNAWTGELMYSYNNASMNDVHQIIADDPFVIVKTSTHLICLRIDLQAFYWSTTNIVYTFGADLGNSAGHITPLLNRFQLIQHQVLAGIVNGSDANTDDGPYSGHRAVRVDYDQIGHSCIWHLNLNSEVMNTPAVYLNETPTDYGGNNTTVGSGHLIPGYGEGYIRPPTEGFDVDDKNVIFFTAENWLYCLRADDGDYSIIQDAAATNATYTNPRHVTYINDQDSYPCPVVMYHIKVIGNNSYGGGDGFWLPAPTACDAVFFLTSDGYGNGVCLWDFTGNWHGFYTWPEDTFNHTDLPIVFYQSYAADEAFNYYDDNPIFNDSFLYVGDGNAPGGIFYKISTTDGVWAARPFGATNFRIDSPIFNEGRIYTLTHSAAGTVTLLCMDVNLLTVWSVLFPGGVMGNMTGMWNPEPCLAFDTVFVCSHEIGAQTIWAQRDNEPPWVDCGELVIYPVIGQQYDFYNASCGDYDGTVENITWNFRTGFRYTLDCNFTFWTHQSTTGYLNVTDDDAAMTSDSFTIIPQLPHIPVVNITWDGSLTPFATEAFNGSGTTGTNLTWWNWSIRSPNGAYWYDNGTNQTMNRTFPVINQIYNITLNVTDEWFQLGTQSILAMVYVASPVANITWDEWAVVGVPETFNGSDSTGTNITWWNWTMEQNGTYWYDNGTNQSIIYTFLLVNVTYNITLNATDYWGQSNATTFPIWVYPTEQPQFNWSSRPTDGFAGHALVYSFTSNNTTIVYWDWGDGSSSTTPDGNATHTWGKWGTYTVSVTVWNDQGVSNTVTFDVTIHIFDFVGMMSNLWWVLLILVALLMIKYAVRIIKNREEDVEV